MPKCPKCHSDEVYEHPHEGSRICHTCGTVLEMGMIQDEPEWRNFEGEPHETRRCQHVDDTLLPPHLQMGTGQGQKGTEARQYARYVEGFKLLDQFGDRLLLAPSVLKTAKAMFSLLRTRRSKLPNQNLLHFLAAICYRAAMIHGCPRTVVQLCQAFGVPRDRIFRHNLKKLNRYLVENQEFPYTSEGDQVFVFIHDFLRRLDHASWGSLVTQQAKLYLKNFRPFDDMMHRPPETVAAAAIFSVYKIARVARSSSNSYDYENLASRLLVNSKTMRLCARDMHEFNPHRRFHRAHVNPKKKTKKK